MKALERSEQFLSHVEICPKRPVPFTGNGVRTYTIQIAMNHIRCLDSVGIGFYERSSSNSHPY